MGHRFLVSYLRLPALLCAMSIAAASFAADQAPPTSAQLDEAYQQLLKNPQDETLLLHYAGIAIALKNYEAAIPPLESLLMSDPDNADLKLRIGALYVALGSKLLARQYLEDARDTQGASAQTVDQAKEYLNAL